MPPQGASRTHTGNGLRPLCPGAFVEGTTRFVAATETLCLILGPQFLSLSNRDQLPAMPTSQGLLEAQTGQDGERDLEARHGGACL